MRNTIMLLLLLVFAMKATAQSNIDNVLAAIKTNNKSIIAEVQYWEAEKLQYKTGLNPDNPVVEYDYLKGSPANAGNQTDLTISQSFDFPTVYTKRNQLAKGKIAQTEHKLNAARQDILLEAKMTCIELVYLNKLRNQLIERKSVLEVLLRGFQLKLEKGEGNILDVNKAKLQLIEIKKEYQENASLINQRNLKLTELNGGNLISLLDTVYPVLPLIPPFEQLESEYESNDPLRKDLEQEKSNARKQIEVSKALAFPKLELGFHYQGIIGQNYNGVHTGLTLPLWENKNIVRQRKAAELFADYTLQAHVNEHYFHIKHIYEKYSNLKIILNEYETSLPDLRDYKLLNKALTAGQFSAIEYFMEASFFFTAIDNYLETEKEYYLTVAELYKYQL